MPYMYYQSEFAKAADRIDLAPVGDMPTMRAWPESPGDWVWTAAVSRQFPSHVINCAWVTLNLPGMIPVVLVYGEEHDDLELFELIQTATKQEAARSRAGRGFSATFL